MPDRGTPTKLKYDPLAARTLRFSPTQVQLMNRKKILVVDDEDDIRKMVVSALESFGFQVFDAPNGQEGLQSFLSFSPDLCLLDIRMPGIGGIQLCELIRHRSKVPIIIFSAVDDREEVVEAIQKGANDYVLKGVGPAGIVERVNRVLNSSGGADVAVGAQVAPDDEKWSTKDSDVPIAVLVHSDRRTRTEMREVLRQTQAQVREAETGQEALNTVKRFNPLVVVVESTLPDMSGNDFLKAIKDHPRRDGIAVIVASDRRSPEAQRRAFYFGAQDYVNGPWDDGKLSMAVHAAMMKAKQHREQVKQAIAERQAATQSGAKPATKAAPKKKAS